MIKAIFIDMDGVLCDFVKSALARHGRMDKYPVQQFDMAAELGISDAKFWKPLVGHEFWRDIEPYEWLDDILNLARAFSGGNITLATSPCSDPFSASGKIEWIKRHAKSMSRSFLIGPGKHHMAKNGAVLIDDNEGNCDKFIDHGGDAILFPQPWNRHRKLCGDRIEYVKCRLEQC